MARAVELTREAGAMAMRRFRREQRAWEKAPGSIVTETDLAIDAFLKARLPRVGEAWLSEETSDDPVRLKAQRVWIVDPIDGTRSYAAGKAEFVVSVALWHDDRIVLGIVLNPATDELYTVGHADGVRLNDAPVTTRPWADDDRTLLLVSGREARTAGFDRHFERCEVRGLGSLAYRLARIAAGRADGLVSLRETADWDLAAAARMCEVAGAVVTDRQGEPLRFNRASPVHDGLVVATPSLHGRLLAKLRTLG